MEACSIVEGGGLTPNFILAANIHKFQYKKVNTHGVATFWKNVKNWRKKKEMNCEIDLIGMSTVYYPSFEHDKLLQFSSFNFYYIFGLNGIFNWFCGMCKARDLS